MKEVERIYQSLNKIFKRYMDMDERYYKIASLWTIGTRWHKLFQTYPYLYLNATRGSGKTRLLKMIAYFAMNGRVLALPSEAFLFRKAKTMTFCLDELEKIQRKEKMDLRLLLNTAYKKGLYIPRVNKDKKDDAGEMQTEEFETYAPIALANIFGLDDVLQDRCITLILEKSVDKTITKKVEVWAYERDCIKVKKDLQKINQVISDISFFGVTSVNDLMYVPVIWNAVLENMKEGDSFESAFTTLSWRTHMLEPSMDLLNFLRMLNDVKIEGRDLELWLPLFFVAYMVNENVLKEVLQMAVAATEQKKIAEIGANIDNDLLACLAEFIKGKKELEYFTPKEIKVVFAEIIGEEKTSRDGSVRMEAPYWLNAKWVGAALTRLNLVKHKRRRSYGYEVLLDFSKIMEKAKILGCFTSTQTTLNTSNTLSSSNNSELSVDNVGNDDSVYDVHNNDVVDE